MRYELKNVMITSYSTSGSAADDSFDFKDMNTAESGDDSGHDKWIDVLSTDWGNSQETGDGYTASDDLWVRDERDGTASDPLPSEELTLGYTEIEWSY